MNAIKLRKCIEKVLSVTDNPIFIESKKGRIIVGGKNEFHGVVVSVPDESLSSDLFFVLSNDDASHLTKILKNGDVDIRFEGDSVYFKSGKSKMTLGCLVDTEVYLNKVLSRYSEEGMFNIDGGMLSAALKKTRHNTNDSTLRDAVMLGFHLTIENNIVEVMATNGRALALTSFQVKDVKNDYKVVTNPHFETLSRLFDSPQTRISIDKEILSIHSRDLDGYDHRIISALVAGEQKDYRSIFARVLSGTEYEIECDKKELMESLKISDFFTVKDARMHLQLEFSNTGCTVKAKSAKGVSEEELEDIKLINPPQQSLTITLHSDIIMKAIGNSTGETIKIKFGKPNMPCYITDGHVQNALTVLLPT